MAERKKLQACTYQRIALVVFDTRILLTEQQRLPLSD